MPETLISLTIRLPQLPYRELSPNYVRRDHTWTRIRAENTQRDTWLALLHNARDQWGGVGFDGSKKVAITITVRGAGNRMDVPNWVAHQGFKILIDCLTKPKGVKFYGLGILVDDSAKYVSGMAVKVEPMGEPETEIRIEEQQIGDSC